MWPDANIKFQYFEKQLQATSQESATALLTFLAILRSILKAQPKFLLKNLRSLTPLLRPAFEHHTANDKMVVLLCDFLRDALASLAEPPGAPPAPELGAFLRWLSEMIGHGLLAVSLSKEAAVHGSVKLLQAVSEHRPLLLDQHLGTLSKLMSRLAKEHVQRKMQLEAAQAQQTLTQAQAAAAAATEETQLATLKLAISLMSTRLVEMGEGRRVYSQTLLALIERSSDPGLLLLITKVVGPWLTAPPGPPPALAFRDRALFVVKMTAFEVIDSAELHKAFLELVHALHADPNLARPELLQKIEPAFMIGLRTKDAELRAKFFAILQKQSGAAAAQRLAFIIQTQDWESLASTLWLRQVTHLLLSTASPEQPLPSARRAPARRPHPRPAQARRRRRRRGGDARGAPQVAERVHGGGVGRFNPLSSRRTDPRPVERRGRARALGARVCARVGPAQGE